MPTGFGHMDRLIVSTEVELPSARVQITRLNNPAPAENMFRPNDVFWMDICLTPRRPNEFARYADRWGPHRFAKLGAVIALPPGETIHLKTNGGRRTSLICQLRAAAVRKFLARDFEFSDRRLEACLDIANATIRSLLLRLADELHSPGAASIELIEAITLQLSIELARYLTAMREVAEIGGLATWRLRVIDERLTNPGPAPPLGELAALCKLSARQLTRAFRMSRGCSIGDYMTQTRIEMAKRQLATDISIKEVATSMGFSSQSSFTYAFRRTTGATPSQFRTQILRAGERSAGRR